jgi:hypothetical protein
MPFSSSAEPALPAAWTDVLDRIQHVLADVLQATEARARALDTSSLEEASLSRRLSEAELLTRPSKTVEDCEELGGEIEQVLTAAQAALSQWLETAAQVRQRLAELTARAI